MICCPSELAKKMRNILSHIRVSNIDLSGRLHTYKAYAITSEFRVQYIVVA